MSGIDGGAVFAEQDLRLVGPGRVIVPLTASLRYSRQDPYAVRMLFDVGTFESAEWAIDRGLLAAALHAPAGMGDVRAWPSVSAAPPGRGAGTRERVLTIVLGPPDACARFEASAAGIEAFLARTYELVPGGQEPGCLDLDAELAGLLGQE